MLTYDDMNSHMADVETIYVWRSFGGVCEVVIQHAEHEGPYVYHSDVGITVQAFCRVGFAGWGTNWRLDLDPDNMPQALSDFDDWLNNHIFIRLDNPENTVPPFGHPDFKWVYLPTAFRASWMTANPLEHLGLTPPAP